MAVYEFKIDKLLITRYQVKYENKGIPGYDISCNGGFYIADPQMRAAQASKVDNQTESGDTRKNEYFTRAGIGMKNSQILIRRYINNPRKTVSGDIEETFGFTPDVYMGGGFMVIDNGRIIPKNEIISGQGYNVQQAQLDDPTNHVLVGNYNNSAYLLIVTNQNYNQVIGRLKHYSHLGWFDGGRACWVRSEQPKITIHGRGPDQVDPPYFALGIKGTHTKTY